jgi:hypothetical protein
LYNKIEKSKKMGNPGIGPEIEKGAEMKKY